MLRKALFSCLICLWVLNLTPPVLAVDGPSNLEFTPALRAQLAAARKRLAALTAQAQFICVMRPESFKRADRGESGFDGATVVFYDSGYVNVGMPNEYGSRVTLDERRELARVQISVSLAPGSDNWFEDFFFGPYVFQASNTRDPAEPDSVYREFIYPRSLATSHPFTATWPQILALSRRLADEAERPGSCEPQAQ